MYYWLWWEEYFKYSDGACLLFFITGAAAVVMLVLLWHMRDRKRTHEIDRESGIHWDEKAEERFNQLYNLHNYVIDMKKKARLHGIVMKRQRIR
ncbi:MAG: hypothetical protein Q7J73_06285 [Dehalococcoidales bacterium]|nr:hypothetical protein [Dehalococcoidales bacterium]